MADADETFEAPLEGWTIAAVHPGKFSTRRSEHGASRPMRSLYVSGFPRTASLKS